MEFVIVFFVSISLGLASKDLKEHTYKREKRDSPLLGLKEFTKEIKINRNRLPGILDKNGNRCVTKQVVVKETIYEREKQCKHAVKEKCHLTYITDYHSEPHEVCETNYVKDCHIVYKPTPHTERVKKCHVPYIRECKPGNKGPLVCTVVLEDYCETRFENYTIKQDMPSCKLNEMVNCETKPIELLNLPNSNSRQPFAFKNICKKIFIQKCRIKTEFVLKIHPKTECKKESKKMCFPNNCKSVAGNKICSEEVQTLVQSIPEEECDLHPQEDCKVVSMLVPRLVPKKNCIKVPREICINVKSKPKVIPRNVPKIWCYNPDELLKQFNITNSNL